MALNSETSFDGDHSTTTVKARDLVVEFPIYNFDRAVLRLSTLKRFARGGLTQSASAAPRIVALKGVSFDLCAGDRVGLIGRNGAGKSTLLRTIGGIYEPQAGSMETVGRVSGLLSFTIGAQVDLSGFENIRVCGLLMGLMPEEIKAKTPEIVAFSELGDFIHLPLRTYSQGMVMRLAFSIATALDPEILLIDETAVAGDAHFMQKAKERLDRLIDRSSLLVFASHAESLVRNICNKAMLLDDGHLRAIGPVDEIYAIYRETLSADKPMHLAS